MSGGAPRVFTIAPGAAFLPTLVEALAAGDIVPGFRHDRDPLKLAGATIYVPTRRAARELRSIFVEKAGAGSAILPTVRPLGEFDEDEAAFGETASGSLDLAPPIAAVDRLLHLAPLVRLWKSRLPAEVAARFEEEVTVPASAADAIWLARDLAALMDEIETEGSDWTRLGGLAPDSMAGWWQVTLDFLAIVTRAWPDFLAEKGWSNPAAHRNALIRLEAARLKANPPAGPVVAAGSTGSIPATAELLAAIARLPNGAVVLPGLDRAMDEESWSVLMRPDRKPAVLGHPQYGLAKLLGRIGVTRGDVEEVGEQAPALRLRERLVSEALRPAETTDGWVAMREKFDAPDVEAALAGIQLVEAPRERDEALAVAIALKQAVDAGGTAALVTGDRDLARRVSAELLRFGVQADDSGGRPLMNTPSAALLRLMLEAVFRPGDPVPVVSLLKHPLLSLGLPRATVRHAAETVELVALRGGTGRPDVASLDELFEQRLAALQGEGRKPFWARRIGRYRSEMAQKLLAKLAAALRELAAFRKRRDVTLAEIVRATVVALEALGRDENGGLTTLYGGDAGEKLAESLRALVATSAGFDFAPAEWPRVMDALIGAETVKPSAGAERRLSIWGALEARLMSVDTLVIGGLNEGSWPRRAEADRFMSRMMKSGLELEPPERRIGQAAHDFAMALGTGRVVLTRSARAGEAPAVASRWLQRLATFAGKDATAGMRARGAELLSWAAAVDAGPRADFARRPEPKPPLKLRPKRFSVTQIETLRRDPYAIYAREVLKLAALDPLLRDPEAAERGTLFHEILHGFSSSGVDPADPAALGVLLETGRACFSAAALPPDVEAVWWPRFRALAGGVIGWDAPRAVTRRASELRADETKVGRTGVTLRGVADRIDLHKGAGADILDFKTGSSPSKGQAHTLLAPQLALEGALLKRAAFGDVGKRQPSELAYVRLKANGLVIEESILKHSQSVKTADELSEEAWTRLEKLLEHYNDPNTGYLSRAVPFREGELDGEYDHLARVLEWSSGGDGPDAEGAGE
ncbi:double-strand break repair protein AddB [Mesorhizobium sp. ZMM04-5]|uniref:Double-strand break repair protein AddB n=1 Tax=Mesorhizobium marinum TaxID=3228790 RepID=A0ABV3QYR4_9HYPH